ncbi:hypothetical protein Ais01nite_06660 [Asanoa ishikariensis]|uniref:Uncharacterized protein n=1 Tax=Asanoa ishikariensis TaxID=137265 RepID=A0A1H3TDH0_9ACTN|nr:hypothetical protein [Asanoa ishikariensis]GIF62631.1 hypothetical protein Ais01nite_06660 [Asanoa ishikariensis]SDZ48302.1 hypothetical protein SAMN05421684_5568 [Asanoa ishikariensis]
MISTFAFPAIVLVGLVLAIGLRRRLGRAAGVAIAGFAVLAATEGLSWWWDGLAEEWARGTDYSGGPLPDLPIGLAVTSALGAVAHAAGLALLIAAVLRRRPQA